MAEVVPFRAVRYNPAKVGGLDQVIGPPYDVIGPDEQDALYCRSPYNFVRIMLNRQEPGDHEGVDPYSRAADSLREWLANGILVEDLAPAYYVYRQEFANPADGKRYMRTGLCAALKLEPYSAGVVLPHEETRSRAKEDRLRLMRATSSNPEPIFALYEDPGRAIASVVDSAIAAAEPLMSATVEGDRHEVWRIDEPAAIAAIGALLADKRVWIADGHHRYETGLTYRDERRAQQAASSAGERAPYDHLLMVLTAFDDPGIVVLPTHRLVTNIPKARLDQLYLQLERYFEIEPVHPDRLAAAMSTLKAGADEDAAVHRFGLFMPGQAWVLTLRDEAVMDAAVEVHAACWKRLDVSILQTLVLDRSLGIPVASLATTTDVGYTRDRDDALVRVQAGEYQMALLLNDPSAQEVRDVAAAGDKMPAKSTFFYPKLWSGLFMRRV